MKIKSLYIHVIAFSGFFMWSSTTYALDVPEAYIALINAPYTTVITNPGDSFLVSFTDFGGGATTTGMTVNPISTFIGRKSMELFNSGNNNEAFGNSAGRGLYNGLGNVFVGDSTGTTGNANSTWNGDNNIFLGHNSASDIDDSGSAVLNYNTFIGSNSPTNTEIYSGNHNILLGGQIALPLSDGSYQLNIGNIIYGSNISGINANISPGTTGIGTTSPLGRFSIQANNDELNSYLFVIASSTVSNNATLYSIDNLGHHIYGGPNPMISSCGTGSSVQGNDNRGRIITGSSTGTSCILIFAASWSNSPVCTVNQEVGGNKNILAAPSSTSTTFKSNSSLNNITFTYSCDGF